MPEVIEKEDYADSDSWQSPTILPTSTILSMLVLATTVVAAVMASLLSCACCGSKTKRHSLGKEPDAEPAAAPTSTPMLSPVEPCLEEQSKNGSNRVSPTAALEKTQIRKQEVIAKALLGLLKASPSSPAPASKKLVPSAATRPISTTPTAKQQSNAAVSSPVETKPARPLAVAKTVYSQQPSITATVAPAPTLGMTVAPNVPSEMPNLNSQTVANPTQQQETALGPTPTPTPVAEARKQQPLDYVPHTRQDYMTLAFADSQAFGKEPPRPMPKNAKGYVTVGLATMMPTAKKKGPARKLTPIDTLFLAKSQVFDKKKKTATKANVGKNESPKNNPAVTVVPKKAPIESVFLAKK